MPTEVSSTPEHNAVLLSEIKQEVNRSYSSLLKDARTDDDRKDWTTKIEQKSSLVDQFPDEIIPLFSPNKKIALASNDPTYRDSGRSLEVRDAAELILSGYAQIFQSDEGTLLVTSRSNSNKFALLRNNALARPDSCTYMQMEDDEAILIKKAHP